MQNGVLKFAFETHVHMVLLRIILALKVFQKYRRQRAFFSKCDVKLEVYCNYCGRSFDQAATLSLRGPAQFTHEARSAEFTGRVGLMDGVSKVSFNILYTLWVYRSCICILINIVKSCPHKFLVGLKCWSSWGSGCKNSKTPSRWYFLKIVLKVDLQILPSLRGLFAKKIICDPGHFRHLF